MTFGPVHLAAAASALSALTFLIGHRVHLMQIFLHDRQAKGSFGAGASTDCLLVKMMPELPKARSTLGADKNLGTASSTIVYLVALTGFLPDQGLDQYGVAVSFHFLAVDHSLEDELGER